MGFFSGLGGAIIGGGLDYFSAKDTQSKQKKMAREQMAFQERMSNTSYQRAVKDMRAAGINPMLAIMQGGASTPAGAQANMVTPTPGATGAKSLQASSQASLIRLQKDLVAAQTNTAKALAAKTAAEASKAQTMADYYRKHPNMAPAVTIGGLKGAVAEGAYNLGTGSSAKSLNEASKALQSLPGKAHELGSALRKKLIIKIRKSARDYK